MNDEIVEKIQAVDLPGRILLEIRRERNVKKGPWLHSIIPFQRSVKLPQTN